MGFPANEIAAATLGGWLFFEETVLADDGIDIESCVLEDRLLVGGGGEGFVGIEEKEGISRDPAFALEAPVQVVEGDLVLLEEFKMEEENAAAVATDLAKG